MRVLPTRAAEQSRRLLGSPDYVGAGFWITGAILVAGVIPLRDWSDPEMLLLAASVLLAAIAAVVRVTIGPRLPRWSLQVDLAVASVAVLAAVAVARTESIDISNLYILIAVYTIVYLPSTIAFLHLGVNAVAFGLLIAVGPTTDHPGFAEWFSVFGVSAVTVTVVAGLMSILRVAALEDPLTGLPNRRAWDDQLSDEISRSRRTGSALSVAMIDLDGFKAVNDRSGHDAGDDLMRSLAAAWKDEIRSTGDVVARVGGDEFAVLAIGADNTGIASLVDRLRTATPVGIAWSFGSATWDGVEDASVLLRRADQAMYEAKQRR